MKSGRVYKQTHKASGTQRRVWLTAYSSGVTFSTSKTTASKLLSSDGPFSLRDSELLLLWMERHENNDRIKTYKWKNIRGKVGKQYLFYWQWCLSVSWPLRPGSWRWRRWAGHWERPLLPNHQTISSLTIVILISSPVWPPAHTNTHSSGQFRPGLWLDSYRRKTENGIYCLKFIIKQYLKTEILVHIKNKAERLSFITGWEARYKLWWGDLMILYGDWSWRRPQSSFQARSRSFMFYFNNVKIQQWLAKLYYPKLQYSLQCLDKFLLIYSFSLSPNITFIIYARKFHCLIHQQHIHPTVVFVKLEEDSNVVVENAFWKESQFSPWQRFLQDSGFAAEIGFISILQYN